MTESQAGCTEMLEHEECRRFLTPAIFTILTKRLIEAKVPEGDRVYCPYPNCSALMDKSGLGVPEQVLNHFISSSLNVVAHAGYCNLMIFSVLFLALYEIAYNFSLSSSSLCIICNCKGRRCSFW